MGSLGSLRPLGALGIVCLIAGSLQAQVTTGALGGTVMDEAGNPIAGARVILESPALFQPRVVSTDAKGEYRALLLPIGAYTIKVSAAGKRGKEARDVRVGIGSILSFPFALKALPQSSIPAVECDDHTTFICCDSDNAATITSSSLLPLDASFHRLLYLTPGTTGEGMATSYRGSSPYPGFNSLRYTLDGTEITEGGHSSLSRVGSQGFFVEPIPMSVEDAMGPSPSPNARQGGSLGTTVNLSTDAGSNTFHGGLQWDLNHATWRAETDCATSVQDASSNLKSGLQAFASGPIVKDRMWFALGVRKQPDQALAFLQDAGGDLQTLQRERTQYQAQLTGALNDSHTLSVSLLSEQAKLEGFQRESNAPMESKSIFSPRASAWALHWNGTLASNITVEAIASSSESSNTDASSSPGSTLENPQYGLKAFRLNTKAFWEAKGYHEVDMGLEGTQSMFRPGGQSSTSQSRSRSLWVNDIWRPNHHWTLMGGLRANSYELSSFSLNRDQLLEPRFQVKWNHDGRDREILSASVARYSSRFPSDLIPASSSSLKTPSVLEYVLGYTRNYYTGSARINLVRRTYVNEFMEVHPTGISDAVHVQNSDHPRVYQGLEAGWEHGDESVFRFGGTCTLAPHSDSIATAYLTKKWNLPNHALVGVGILSRYTPDTHTTTRDSNASQPRTVDTLAPGDWGTDTWTADARLTVELSFGYSRRRLRFSLDIQNLFNRSTTHSKRPSTGDLRNETTDPTASGDDQTWKQAWKTVPTSGRTVARLSLAFLF